VELHALMAPRPFLVSGGTLPTCGTMAGAQPRCRRQSVLGFENRVAMTNRKEHGPSKGTTSRFIASLEWWLKRPASE